MDLVRTALGPPFLSGKVQIARGPGPGKKLLALMLRWVLEPADAHGPFFADLGPAGLPVLVSFLCFLAS